MRFPPPPIVLNSKNVTFFIPKRKKQCPQRFPASRDIQCARRDGHNGACNKTSPSPYYSVTWEVDGYTKKE